MYLSMSVISCKRRQLISAQEREIDTVWAGHQKAERKGSRFASTAHDLLSIRLFREICLVLKYYTSDTIKYAKKLAIFVNTLILGEKTEVLNYIKCIVVNNQCSVQRVVIVEYIGHL